MTRFLFFFFACFFAFIPLKAQVFQHRIDSLQLVLNKTSDNARRIDLLGEISVAYANLGNHTQAYALAKEALTLSNKTPDDYYKALAHHRLGYTYLVRAKNDSAIIEYALTRQLLADHRASVTAKKLYIKSTNNLAMAYDNEGHSEKAMELVISVLPVIEALKDTVMYAVVLHNVSAGLTTMGAYKRAYPYMQKDISFRETTGSPEGIATAYLSGALLMYYLDSMDRSKQYLDLAAQKLNLVGKTELWGRYHSYLAFYYTKIRNYTLAQQACNKALADLKVYDTRTNLYDVYEAQKDLYAGLGDYKQARQAAYAIHQIADEDELSNYQLSSLKDIADFSQKMGDSKEAWLYLEKYTSLRDSIERKQVAFKISEMEARYRSAQKEQQILQLQNRARIQKLLFFGAVSLSVLILLFFLYRFKQKKIQSAQQLQSLDQERQIAVTQALLTGEERERSRLARDLHDGLGGMLAGVKMNLSRITEKAPSQIHPELSKTVNQLGDSVNELRHIARNMMPESLLKSGLAGALKDLCESYITPERRIILNTYHVADHIIPQQQLIIYRMVQEILNNAVKHSGADKILVQCTQAEGIFYITVEDNGKGFDVAHKGYEGIGLENIRNRVDFLRGSLHIDSSKEGTVINIEFHVTNQ